MFFCVVRKASHISFECLNEIKVPSTTQSAPAARDRSVVPNVNGMLLTKYRQLKCSSSIPFPPLQVGMYVTLGTFCVVNPDIICETSLVHYFPVDKC